MIEVLAELGKHVVYAVGYADAGLKRAGTPAHRADFGAERFGLFGAVVIVDRDIATG